MSVLRIAVASVLALSLVIGLALPALADSDEAPFWKGDFKASLVKGTVTGVDEQDQGYFVVQSGEDELTIEVDGNTKYFIWGAPGRFVALAQQFRLQNQTELGAQSGQGLKLGHLNQVEASVQNQAGVRIQNQIAQAEGLPLCEPQPARWQWLRPFRGGAEFGDIEVGDRVVVWLADGENLAKWVLIVKPATRAIVSGAVTGVTPETITIDPDEGEALTLGYNGDTVFVLRGFTSVEEGQTARAVYDSEQMLARKVVVSLD